MPCRIHMIREIKAIGNAVGDYELLRRRAHGAWLVIGLAMTVIVAGCGTEDGTRFDVEEGVVYNRGEGLWSESGAPPVTFSIDRESSQYIIKWRPIRMKLFMPSKKLTISSGGILLVVYIITLLVAASHTATSSS